MFKEKRDANREIIASLVVTRGISQASAELCRELAQMLDISERTARRIVERVLKEKI